MWDDEEVGGRPGVEAGVEAGVDPGVEAGVDPDAGADEAEAGGGNGTVMAGPAGRFVEDNGEVDGDSDQGGEQDVDGDRDSEGEDGPGVASSRGGADGRDDGDDVMQLLPEGLVERDEHLEQLRAMVALKSVATVADCLGEERETVAHLLDRTLVMDRSMRALVEREVATDDGLGFELEQFVEAGEAVPDAPIALDLQGSFQEAEEAELAAA